jgi:hypothetical protein
MAAVKLFFYFFSTIMFNIFFALFVNNFLWFKYLSYISTYHQIIILYFPIFLFNLFLVGMCIYKTF